MVSEQSSSEPTTLASARTALDAGAAWRARDLLAAHVETERDPEALALLGEVYQGMGDLPRAGAVWFAAGATGPQADAAVAAWRAQSHDDFGVMWRSLPASVRVEPLPRRIEALRERARAAGADMHEAPATASQGESGGIRSAKAADKVSHGVVQVVARDGDEAENDEDGFDWSWLVAWVLAVAFVVFAVIGFVTALGWVVPG